jgi:aminoglycoside 3-N-acetyltransferase I
MRIERVVDADTLGRGAGLFDDPPQPEFVTRFLGSPGHHLLFAFDEAGRPVGFISGVELTHPDKGTEMFVNELGVDEAARNRGVGTSLVEALGVIARDAGCYGMWVISELDNAAAYATYRRAGASAEVPGVVFSWDL